MTATLRAFLVNSSRALGVEPQHLKDPAADGDVQNALLKDVIALREMGHADRSLALVDVAAEAGLASDWIEDNRARALLALGRTDEAQALLQSLSGCGTETVAMAAREQLAALGGAMLAPEPTATEESTDPTPVLEEAIRLRESGEPEASLQVLDHALAQGVQSPWIDDNRARALVNLDRCSEAVVLWQALLQSESPALRRTAASMLELHEARGVEQGALLEVDRLLEQAIDRQQGVQAALECLTDALLRIPESDALRERLQALAVARGAATDEESAFSELDPHRQKLAMFDALLSVLERRCAAVSN